jgi:hypothetical protein
MDQNKIKGLKEAHHRNEIQAISKFNFPFPRFDIIPKVGIVIKLLQGFGMLHAVGLDPN